MAEKPSPDGARGCIPRPESKFAEVLSAVCLQDKPLLWSETKPESGPGIYSGQLMLKDNPAFETVNLVSALGECKLHHCNLFQQLKAVNGAELACQPRIYIRSASHEMIL